MYIYIYIPNIYICYLYYSLQHICMYTHSYVCSCKCISLKKQKDKIYRYRGVRIFFLKIYTFCMHDHSCTRNVNILASMYTTYTYTSVHTTLIFFKFLFFRLYFLIFSFEEWAFKKERNKT